MENIMESPEIIYNVSCTQLSIARHYGGIKFNGVEYVYNHVDDTLRKKVKAEKKAKKSLQTSWI
jgi:hypothetical protein